MSETKPTPEEILRKQLYEALNREAVVKDRVNDLVEAIDNFIYARAEELAGEAITAHEDQYDHNMIYEGEQT